MKLQNILANIGLTQNEAKCYLALLKSGSLTIQELSKKTGIHRVNLYSVIQSLEIKGAVSFTIKGKYRKQIVPANPRSLIELIRKKQRVLKKAELKFTDIVPELTGLMRQAKEHTSIRYFEGLEGAKQVFNDTLTAGGDLKGFSNVNILHEYIPEELMDEYRRKKSDLGLTGRFIVPLSPKAKNYVPEKYTAFGLSNVPEVKCLPADLFNFFAEMDIYDDKVSIVSLNREEQIGIIIESKAVSKSFSSIFEVLWKMAKSV
ncbi:MAG: helix-turn-helix domain-containing protein [Patescibacteria group bacterium]